MRPRKHWYLYKLPLCGDPSCPPTSSQDSQSSFKARGCYSSEWCQTTTSFFNCLIDLFPNSVCNRAFSGRRLDLIGGRSTRPSQTLGYWFSCNHFSKILLDAACCNSKLKEVAHGYAGHRHQGRQGEGHMLKAQAWAWRDPHYTESGGSTMRWTMSCESGIISLCAETILN